MKKVIDKTVIGLWEDLALRPFLGEVRRKHGIVETLALPSMRDLPPVRIETLFVPPLLNSSAVSADSDPNLWPKGESLFEAFSESPQLVVLGDPGGGKTTLANWLAWRLTAGLSTPLPKILENKIPLPCVLRDINISSFTNESSVYALALRLVEKLIGDKPDKNLINSLEMRIELGLFVLILDGVDEIPIAHREIVASWILEAKEKNACVLATSRIVGYEDYPIDRLPIFDSKKAKFLSHSNTSTLEVPINPSEIGKSKAKINRNLKLDIKLQTELILEHVDIKENENFDASPNLIWAEQKYLMPFDNGRIAAFAENWYQQRYSNESEAKEKTFDFLESLNKSEVTKRLARTPNLLSLMAIVHRERNHLPDGKAELYDDITNAYINTIDKQRRIPSGDTLSAAGWKKRKAWLAFVGFKMQELRGASTNTYTTFDDGVLVNESEVLKWLTEAMHVSLVQDAEVASKIFLSWVARRSGLLLPRGEGRYAFVHLSFQEYFCGCFIADRIVNPSFIKDTLDANALVTKAKLIEWSKSSLWRETLVFVFELLSAEYGTDWVDNLTEILFGSVKTKDQFLHSDAALAARAISDRHIQLSPSWKTTLAERCIFGAWGEWQDLGENDEFPILAPLIEADYGVIISEPLDPDSVAFDLFMESKLQVRQLKECNNWKSLKLNDELLFFISAGTSLENIDPISSYKRLKWIHLSDNPIKDISALAGLSELICLNLNATQVKSIDSISTLHKLSNLELNSTPIKNISPISSLLLLDSLSISKTAVSDISPLSKLRGISHLDIRNTLISDLSPISNLTNLRNLNCAHCPISDIYVLNRFKELTWLNLSHTSAKDLVGISELLKLRWLDLSNTNIESVQDLNKLVNVRWLNLSNTFINDLAGLDELKNLFRLTLIGTKISDLSPLFGISSIQDLRLDSTHITDISFINEIRLNNISLSNTRIKDLSGLKENTSVTNLNIRSTLVEDIAPLKALTKLRFLNFENTQVHDVEPLKGMANLRIRQDNKWVNVIDYKYKKPIPRKAKLAHPLTD